MTRRLPKESGVVRSVNMGFGQVVFGGVFDVPSG